MVYMKIIASFIVLMSSLFLIACSNAMTLDETVPTAANDIAAVGTVVSDFTKEADSTVYYETSNDKKNETTLNDTLFETVSTEAHDGFIFTPVGDNEWAINAKFTGFYNYPSTSYFSKEQPYQRRRNNSNSNELKDVKKAAYQYGFYELTIAGYTGETSIFVDYILTEHYVYLKDLLSNEYMTDIYNAKMEGIPGTPCYGCYTPQIGDKFIVYFRQSFLESKIKEKGINLVPAFKIEEIDGVKWVYPDIYTDFSSMKCAVKITDEAERLFYKEGKDDEILAYMENNNIPNPTIDYKCELNAFVEELRRTEDVDTKNFTPVGEYTSILDAFPFEGFAEFPEDMRLDDEHPYLPKSKIDVTTYQPTVENNKGIIVTIIGYKGDETYENGMYYSTYYVYAEPWKKSVYSTCSDDTVYEMRVYGTPSHPYYGQHRIEIGDRFLRLETDNSFVQTDVVLPATSLFWLTGAEKQIYMYFFADFNTDFSNVIVYTSELDKVNEDEKHIYKEGRDDDVIAYMKENEIEPPVYEKKAAFTQFSTIRRIDNG